MTRLTIATLALASCQLALAETIVLKQPVAIPLFLGGKNAGTTKAPAGSQVEILAREGSRIQIKFRGLEPVWVESSLLGTEEDAPSAQTTPSPAPSTFDPSKAIKALEEPGTNAITSLLQDRKYPDPASQDEFSSSLAMFVDAKARIAKGQRALPSIQQEVKRLRRNADVTGQPNPLNPGDISGQERAQKIRDEADAMEAEAQGEIANAQEQLDEAKSSLTQLLEGWQTAEANVREEQARIEEEKKTEDSKLAQDEVGGASDQVEAGASASTDTTEQSEAEPESHRNETYTELNEKAIWSINFWDKDGDNLLAWTENWATQSGLSSEDASEEVILTVDTLAILSPETIAAEGGRTRFYKDLLLCTQCFKTLNLREQKQTRSKEDGSHSSASAGNNISAAREIKTDATPVYPIDGNDAEAQYRLGLRHLRFYGGAPPDFERGEREDMPWDVGKGVALVKTAADSGYAPAQCAIGEWHADGRFGADHGLDADPELAVGWWEKAAAQNHPRSQWWLGRCYNTGMFGVEESPEKAFELYSQSAAQGYSIAQVDLASFYEQGRVVERDFPKAFELYLQAAERGDFVAQRKVADCYRDGLGVSRNPEQAAKWLANAEDTKAQRSDREKK